MTQENNKVYGFRSAAAFDRNSRAMRYAERIMKGPLDPRPHQYFPQQPGFVSVRTSYISGGVAVPSEDYDALYPGEFVTYDAEYGTVNVVEEDGDVRPCLIFGVNNEKLKYPNGPDGGKATVYQGEVVGYYEQTDDPNNPRWQCDPDYAVFVGCPIVRVVVSAGGITDEFDCRVTGHFGTDPDIIYDIVEVNPGTWDDKDGGRTGHARRAPSNVTPPPIVAGQYTKAKSDPNNAGDYVIPAWGALVSGSDNFTYLEDVSVSGSGTGTCNPDGSITVDLTITVTKQFATRTETVKARDLSLTVNYTTP